MSLKHKLLLNIKYVLRFEVVKLKLSCLESYLGEYKYGKNYVNAPLQRLYENGFIKQLKQDEWKLQQDAQQPKSSQLWDLPQTET